MAKSQGSIAILGEDRSTLDQWCRQRGMSTSAAHQKLRRAHGEPRARYVERLKRLRASGWPI